MYYIFNSDDRLLSWCDFEPDLNDLQSRNEHFIKCTEQIEKPFDIIIGKYGSLFEPAPNPKTTEELISEQTIKILSERDSILKNTDWMINRQLEQQNLSLTPTMEKQQFVYLLNYRQKLRDITKHELFPFVELPTFNLEG